jgi:hypothetical protein
MFIVGIMGIDLLLRKYRTFQPGSPLPASRELGHLKMVNLRAQGPRALPARKPSEIFQDFYRLSGAKMVLTDTPFFVRKCDAWSSLFHMPNGLSSRIALG